MLHAEQTFASNIKPVPLVSLSKQVQPPGKLADGKIAIPFEFTIQPAAAQKALFDTYHGVYICVQYTLTIEVCLS